VNTFKHVGVVRDAMESPFVSTIMSWTSQQEKYI